MTRTSLALTLLGLLAGCGNHMLEPTLEEIRRSHDCTVYQGPEGITYEVCLPRQHGDSGRRARMSLSENGEGEGT